MATTSTTIQELYTDIVADLRTFIDDAVLLPQGQFLTNIFDISGTAGNTVRVPITNSYTNAAPVSAGGSIKGAANSILNPGEVDVTMSKFGVGSDVQEEALEDGLAIVRQALLERLSGGISSILDINGFETLRDAGGNSTINQDGNATLSGSGNVTNIVMGTNSLCYGVKRQPVVRMWYNPDTDVHEFRASVRAGFAALWNGADSAANYGVRKLNDVDTVGSAALTLGDFAKSVANLRANNHLPMANGLYAAFVSPATEYSVAAQLNSVTQGTIGDLSMVGNRALVSGLIGQAAGCEFFRSNNLGQPA